MKSKTYLAATLFAALAVGAPVFASTHAQSAQVRDGKGQQQENEGGERDVRGEQGESRENSRAQARLARQARITMEQARATALERASGTVESGELEREHGRLVYSFDIRNERGTISEVQVSAINGRVVSVTEETPAQEAAERAADRRQQRRRPRRNQ